MSGDRRVLSMRAYNQIERHGLKTFSFTTGLQCETRLLTISHFVTSRNNNRLRNHPLKLLPYSCELMLGSGYRFSFQTCAFRLAAMLTQIIYGMRSPPAMGDTAKNVMMLTNMATQSTRIITIPPRRDLSPKKITDHRMFRTN